jgi:HK97 family phage major capsid protein
MVMSLLDAKRIREERGPIVQEMKDLMSVVTDAKRSMTKKERNAWEDLDKRQKELLATAESIEGTFNLDGGYDTEEGERLRDEINGKGFGTGQARFVPDKASQQSRGCRLLPPNAKVVTRNTKSYLDTVFPGFTSEQKRQEKFGLADYLRAHLSMDNVSPELRGMVVGTDAQGGFLVPDVLAAKLINYMQQDSVAMQAGCSLMPLDGFGGDYSFAKITSLPTAAFRAEMSPSTDVTFNLARVTFVPRTLAIPIVCSFEMLQDAPNASLAIETAISQSIAAAVDEAVWGYSTAANRPYCFRGSTTISRTFASGSSSNASPPYPKTLISGYETLITQGVNFNQQNRDADNGLSIVCPTALWSSFNRQSNGLGDPVGMPWMVLGSGFYPSNRMNRSQLTMPSSSYDECVMGDMQNIVIGMRQPIRVEISRQRYLPELAQLFMAYCRFDVRVFNENGLTILGGYSTST